MFMLLIHRSDLEKKIATLSAKTAELVKVCGDFSPCNLPIEKRCRGCIQAEGLENGNATERDNAIHGRSARQG